MAKVSRPRVVAKQCLADLDLPEQVTLSLADLARSAKEHLLSLSVAAGLLLLREMFEEEVRRLVGPRGKHRPDRSAYRHGSERRSVTLGARLVEVERPRARTRDGGELALATYAAVADRDLLTEAALARMLVGISTRQYPASLEPVGDVASRGVGRSAVSRRFVSGTQAKLDQLRTRDLRELGLLAVFIDGIQIAEHTLVLALGVDQKAGKHVLGLEEGTTENAAVCQRLLSGLIDRGLPTDRALLFVIDGGKAIRKAIRDTYGALAPVQRCVLHKGRINVADHLPEGLRPVIRRKLGEAWRMDDAHKAERALRRLAASLEEAHPGAAASIREGLEETLTVSRLGLSPALIKTFKSTNPIESLNDGIRVMERNVKNWKSGTMALRWTAAAALEREKRFRKINGWRDLWTLKRALDRHTKEVTSSRTAA